jgi:hypothetical protein
MKSTLSRHIGLELVVADQHLGGQAAELAAIELHRQLKAIADVHAECGAGAGEGADEADLDLVCGLNCGAGEGQQGGDGAGGCRLHPAVSLG